MGRLQRSALDNKSTVSLLRLLDEAATGRLRVGEGATEASVYVMRGDIVAAEAGDDIPLMLRRLHNTGLLTDERKQELEALAELGEPVFGILLEETDPAAMEEVLLDRFKDNLARFLGQDARPGFTKLSAVFVDNIQMGLDARGLIDSCAAAWESAERIDPAFELIPRNAARVGGLGRFVVDRLEPGKSVRQLLSEIPVEPILGRAFLAELVDAGILAIKGQPVQAPPTSEPEVPQGEQEAPEDGEEIGEDRLETEVIERGKTATPVPPPGKTSGGRKVRKLSDVVKKRVEPEPVPEPEAEVAEPEVAEPELEEPEVAEPEVEEPEVEEPELAEPELEEPELAEPELEEPELEEPSVDDVSEDVYDEDSLGLNQSFGEYPETSDPPSVPDLSMGDPAEWMRDLDLEDDELEAFGDHDRVRGGHAEEGAFVTEKHNLDSVDVGGGAADEADEEPEPIEIDEAPHARFGARVLSEDEARQKISIVNEVLLDIIEAFDTCEGEGAGVAHLQLLVDGPPAKFGPLWHDVRLTQEGRIPEILLMRNLHNRPPTEHRQMLNNGLVDLIERALSLSMDELTEDDVVDSLLEKTAGYRQRIGL